MVRFIHAMQWMRESRPSSYLDYCRACTVDALLDDGMRFVKELALPHIERMGNASLQPLPITVAAGVSIDADMHVQHTVGLIVSAFGVVTYPQRACIDDPAKRPIVGAVMAAARALVKLVSAVDPIIMEATSSEDDDEEEEEAQSSERRLTLALHGFQLAYNAWQLAEMPFTILRLEETLAERKTDRDDDALLPFPLAAAQLYPCNPILVNCPTLLLPLLRNTIPTTTVNVGASGLFLIHGAGKPQDAAVWTHFRHRIDFLRACLTVAYRSEPPGMIDGIMRRAMGCRRCAVLKRQLYQLNKIYGALSVMWPGSSMMEGVNLEVLHTRLQLQRLFAVDELRMTPFEICSARTPQMPDCSLTASERAFADSMLSTEEEDDDA